MKRIFLLISFLLCISYLSAYCQTDTAILKKVVSKLNLSPVHRMEKAYLHLDKPYYATGDTIYFKAYVTIGPQHQLSALSGILNIDLIKPDNKIYHSIKLQLTDGVAWGDFALDDTLKAGNYRIRAYTNWMRNTGEDYFFNQNLPVVDAPVSNKKPGKNNIASDKINKVVFPNRNPGKYDVQFFSEGGTLINGASSKIAFKALSSDGLGAMAKGIVTDNEGHEISSFSSQHLGMGAFTLKPETGKTYKAAITFADGSTATFDLPKAADTGYAFNIDNSSPTHIRVSITAGKENPPAQINVVAQSGGIAYYSAKSTPGVKTLYATLPKSRFPTGIVQFTLFSSTGEPLNERLVFINNNDQLDLGVNTAQQSYAPRQKVKIDLEAKDQDGKRATGIFSVAVTDEAKVPVNENTECTILSSLLLTSDLKGYIEMPNYYFTNVSDKTQADLDILMLTQGYHRFEWKQLLNGNLPPVAFQPEKTLDLSGVIKSRWGKPIPKGKVSMLSTSNGFLLLDTAADVNGKFVFAHLPTQDTMRYIIQAADKKFKGNSVISIDNTMAPISKHSMATSTDSNFNAALSTYRLSSDSFHTEQDKQGLGRHAIALKELAIKGKKPLKYLEHSANLRGPGNADQVVTADQLPLGCPVFTDCMKGILYGIDFERVLLVIDGVTLPDDQNRSEMRTDILNTINMNDIASIEVLRYASSAGVYGVRAGNNVLIITTKRGDDMTEPDNIAPGIVSYSPKGFYKARVFYSPRYDVAKADTDHPDLRTTIYWNPNILKDKDGKSSFEFFNADGKGTYRVVIEGIDDKGNLGRQVYRYKVE
jgi:hypothetical protein